MDTIGRRIRAVRGDLSRDDFSSLTGISTSALVNYEKDKRTPDAAYLNQIIQKFPAINPTWLLTGEGPQGRTPPPLASKEIAYLRLRDHIDLVYHPTLVKWKDAINAIGKEKFQEFRNNRNLTLDEEELKTLCYTADWNFESGCPKYEGDPPLWKQELKEKHQRLLEEIKKETEEETAIPFQEKPLERIKQTEGISEENFRLLRDVVEMYECMLENRGEKVVPSKKGKDIALIYRHFREHPEEYHDEVDVSIYVDEWF